MSEEVPVWKYPYFTEFEIKILYPGLPYIEPGEEIADGVVVRDFEEMGVQPKMFRVDNGEIIQLVPVRITGEDGEVETDVWHATISFMTEEELAEYQQSATDDDDED